MAIASLVLVFHYSNFSFAQSAPRLIFDKEIYNFGKIKQGETVEHTFRFKNEGNSNLTIYTVKPTCGCIKAELSSGTIESKEEGFIRVVLDTAKKSGKTSETIYVISNDPKRPNIVLGVLADIYAPQNHVRMYYFYSRDCEECLEIKDS